MDEVVMYLVECAVVATALTAIVARLLDGKRVVPTEAEWKEHRKRKPGDW